MKTITIIDDSHLDSNLIKAWLEKDKAHQVQAIYHSGVDAIVKVEDINTDFCLIDAHMPLLNGVNTITILLKHNYNGKLLLMSHAFSLKCMEEAKNAGAHGYCHKDNESLIHALVSAENNEVCFDEKSFETWKQKSSVIDLHHKDKDPKIDLLNTHHHKILSYSCKGLSTEEIGELMNLKKHTVEQYRAAMLQLLEFKSLAQATAWAVANHLVKPGDVYTHQQNPNLD
jgi:two-component system response regulator NreC